MMDVLEKLGYDFRLYAAARLTYPEFDRTCFVNVERKNIYDRLKAERKYKKDEEIALEFIKFLKSEKGEKPYFAFVFFDGPHGSYDYPPEFEKFRPAHSVNYIVSNEENVLPVFNKYRNSVFYNDYLTGKILDALGERKDESIVLITGDYGEAFFEKGYRGHNHGYGEEEIKVPLVLRLPGKEGGVYEHVTSHMDVAPFIVKTLGVQNPPQDYSNGKDLMDAGGRNFAAAFSWDTAGMIMGDYTFRIPLSSYRIPKITVYENIDYSPAEEEGILKERISLLAEFQRESAKFYK